MPVIDVSIIIPVYNQVGMTERCIRALSASTAIAHEVIVVDNASTDATPGFLDALRALVSRMSDPGLRGSGDFPNPWMNSVPSRFEVITNTENRGFVDACNQAAEMATGRYLCFLNNDTEPQAGWLEHMAAILDADPGVGIVGAKLVFPGGILQEAGGIVFDDAYAWNYGRGGHPADPAANYRREVDYCSGAALLVRTELFRALGGFDRRFAPAYYEDTDLCFAARSRGYKVVYQPHAEVVHHEGATAGRDPSSGFRVYLETNRAKFRDKWRDVLAQRHGPRRRHVDPRAAHRIRGKRILWVDPLLPMYDRASGSRRLWELLSALVDLDHHVTFVPTHMLVDHESRRYVKELQALGVETFAVDLASGWPPGNQWLQPMQIAAKLIESGGYDLAVLSTHYVAKPLIEFARKANPGLPVVADSVDVHFVRERREAELANDDALRRKAEETRRAELAAYAAADAVLVVTEEDGKHIQGQLPGRRILTIPNVHEPLADVPGFEGRRDLLFVGNFQHPPNVDAVKWLHSAILPLLRVALPGARVHVVGNRCPAELAALAADDFVVHGWVEDLGSMLRAARVSVAPLRYGAGMKGKVGEALAWGLPCVTTTIGAEGMALVDGENVLVADDAAGFAKQVARLYGDRQLWQAVSRSGQEVVRSRYGRRKVGAMLDAMIGEFTALPRRRVAGR